MLAVLMVGAAGCRPASAAADDHDAAPTNEFTADADADVYAGPAPLTVGFTASAAHAVGTIHYHWDFDDGTTSTAKSPRHTFRRHRWYWVTATVRDDAGHRADWTLQLRAWRPDHWKAMQQHVDARILYKNLRELSRRKGVKIPGYEGPGSPTPAAAAAP